MEAWEYVSTYQPRFEDFPSRDTSLLVGDDFQPFGVEGVR